MWTEADIPDQTGRTVVITGANSGLGLRSAEVLAAKGARVLMACRSPERGAEALRRVRENGLTKAGVMIEVPAAALRAEHVLRDCDFGSLGTNDLAQYTMAADRMQGELSDLLDPWQPAVLQVIGHACDGAKLAGKPLGVCGEAGGDPLLALVLAGLGVSSLSMAPSKVSLVRFALSLHDLATCQVMAQAALDARTAVDARDAVLEKAVPELRDLL